MKDLAPPKARRKPLLSPSFVSTLLAGHSALGLAMAALIYIVCLSGSLAVFTQELQRWEQPVGPVLTAVPDAAVDAGFNAIRIKAPTLVKEDTSIDLPTPAVPRFMLSAGGHEGFGGEKWFADASGQPVTKVRRPTSDFIAGLHAGLALPEGLGRMLVGLIGVALLALLISGILAHPRIFKDAFSLRRGGSRRLQEADLHNRLGTWGMPFYLMVTLTGTVLGLFFVIFAGLAATAYKGDLSRAFGDMGFPLGQQERHQALATVPPLAPLIATVRAKSPGVSIQSVNIYHAGTSGQKVNVVVHRPGHLSAYDRFVFDTAGRLVDAPKENDETIGRKMLFALQPLHFGWFGGLPIKIAYGLLGIALCVITSTGITVWLARRRDKGRPAPTWERLWTATVWGQPIAITIAAIAPLLFPSDQAALLGWAAGASCAYLTGSVYRNNQALNRCLRFALAALMGAVAVAHVISWYGRMADVAGWAIDAILIVSAVALATPLLRQKPTQDVSSASPATDGSQG